MSLDYTKYFCGEDGYCLDYEKAEIAILPVPYDGTSTWIKGSDKGPEAIIEASGTLEMFDIPTGSDVSKKGIFTAEAVTENKTPEDMAKAVEKSVTKLLKRSKFPVILGGEHSVSIGSFNAFASQYNQLTILQLDAHADLRPSYEGSEYNHACAMYKARKVAPILQVGIRSMCEEERKYAAYGRIFYRQTIREKPNWIDDLSRMLTKNIYLTIDLDVLDPSIMPSTGTPEPDGLLYNDVIELVKAVSKKSNIVGFDVVELCPNSINKAPDFLAAKLIYQILSIIKNK